MHYSEEPQGFSDFIHEAESIAAAADLRTDAEARFLTIVVCDVDIPCCISQGELFVQAPFQVLLDALSAAVVEFFRDLEARISEARSTALASADLFPQVHFKRVAGEDVVRDSGEQR